MSSNTSFTGVAGPQITITLFPFFASFELIDEECESFRFTQNVTSRMPPIGAIVTNAGTLVNESSQAPAV